MRVIVLPCLAVIGGCQFLSPFDGGDDPHSPPAPDARGSTVDARPPHDAPVTPDASHVVPDAGLVTPDALVVTPDARPADAPPSSPIPGHVSGTVVHVSPDGSRRALGGATVALWASAAYVIETHTDSNGAFAIALPATSWFSVTARAAGYSQPCIYQDVVLPLGRDVSIEVFADVDLLAGRITPQHGPVLSGKVRMLTRTGPTVAGAEVSAVLSTGGTHHVLAQTRSDQDGDYFLCQVSGVYVHATSGIYSAWDTTANLTGPTTLDLVLAEASLPPPPPPPPPPSDDDW